MASETTCSGNSISLPPDSVAAIDKWFEFDTELVFVEVVPVFVILEVEDPALALLLSELTSSNPSNGGHETSSVLPVVITSGKMAARSSWLIS